MPALSQINDVEQPGDGAWALAFSVSSLVGASEVQPGQRAAGSLLAVLQDWVGPGRTSLCIGAVTRGGAGECLCPGRGSQACGPTCQDSDPSDSLAFGVRPLQRCMRTVPEPAPDAGPWERLVLPRCPHCAHLAADTCLGPVLGRAVLLSKNEEKSKGFLGGDLGLGAGWGPEATLAFMPSSLLQSCLTPCLHAPDVKAPCTPHELLGGPSFISLSCSPMCAAHTRVHAC